MQANVSVQQLGAGFASPVTAGAFEPSHHFYPRTLNAQLHPLVAYFMRLSTDRIVSRYCHLNPKVEAERLHTILRTPTKHLRWAGADLFHVTTKDGDRRMVVIETNSCPSGNKSMPLLADDQEQGGYRSLVESSFLPSLKKRGLPRGGLAVLFDKNYPEASGYAAALADASGETVWLTPMPAGDQAESAARFRDGILEVRDAQGEFHPIRAAMRYVTQQPWSRIPVQTRTLIFNPVIACLAGGRNKLVASKAYEFFNTELAADGLEIRTPDTIRDVGKAEIPLWVQRFGGHAVVKVPYSNAGQGVYTITSDAELDAFMESEHPYEKFIVQSLIGNKSWSSINTRGRRLYQVGTMPNKRNEIYVSDLRVMIASTSEGFRPIASYARRARRALTDDFDGANSWDMLGTNLSAKRSDGGWDSDTDRLMLMDRKDFNLLGIGIDDLIDGFIQTVLSVVAIDRLAETLLTQKGALRRRLFRSLDDDAQLLEEIYS